MEIKIEKKKKKIVIAGIVRSGTTFMKNAIEEIIKQAGYSDDFEVIKVFDFDKDLEAKAELIFTSFRDPKEIYDSFKKAFPKEKPNVVKWQYELIKWMRSNKHAYCMDYNATENSKGLYNYTTLRNIIMPLNFTYPEAGFLKLNPTLLIPPLMKLHPIKDVKKN